MGMEDVFNGAKSAMTFYDAYLKTVAEEIGMDQAVSLHTKMFETMGEMQGQTADCSFLRGSCNEKR